MDIQTAKNEDDHSKQLRLLNELNELLSDEKLGIEFKINDDYEFMRATIVKALEVTA